MIKFLIEKEFKQSQFVPAEIDSYLSLHDHVIDALGCEYGNKEYPAEYCRQRSFGDFSAAGE